jgi:hypothetical protein
MATTADRVRGPCYDRLVQRELTPSGNGYQWTSFSHRTSPVGPQNPRRVYKPRHHLGQKCIGRTCPAGEFDLQSHASRHGKRFA